MNVYVLKAVLPSVPIGRIFKGLVPFVAADLVRLALLIAFPHWRCGWAQQFNNLLRLLSCDALHLRSGPHFQHAVFG